jgi:hypothetical protein
VSNYLATVVEKHVSQEALLPAKKLSGDQGLGESQSSAAELERSGSLDRRDAVVANHDAQSDRTQTERAALRALLSSCRRVDEQGDV